MTDRKYFKRLDYTKQDIASQPFSNMFFYGDSGNAVYSPIDDFFASVSEEQKALLFDFTKNDREKNCGLGDLYVDEVKEKKNSGFYLKVKPCSGGEKINLFIRFRLDEKNPVLYDQNLIEIEDNSSVKLFIYYDYNGGAAGSKEVNAFRNGLFSIKTGKNSSLDLIKIQNLSDSSINFESLKIDAGENAQIKFYDIQLGAKINGVSGSVYMKEENACVQIFPLYFIDKTRNMDIEHNLIVNGKNSKGNISARGALKDCAKKMFRGNIFLNTGCSGSCAGFADNNIMLDKGITAATIPTIFCDEDDVIGEHAASFEAVNAGELFYLMSRGFDELSAKKLIIDSYFKPVFNMIEDESIKTTLINDFDLRLEGLK